WANLASFRTFTATLNAASPAGLPHPSQPASGGSAIWQDYFRASSGKAGAYAPHSAVRLAEANAEPIILYAAQKTQKTNQQFERLTGKTDPTMQPWYANGADVIFSENDMNMQAIRTK